MNHVTILGAGKIGAEIARLLHRSGDYNVLVGDLDIRALEHLSALVPVDTFVVDVTDEAAIAEKLEKQVCIVSTCPHWDNPCSAHEGYMPL